MEGDLSEFSECCRRDRSGALPRVTEELSSGAQKLSTRLREETSDYCRIPIVRGVPGMTPVGDQVSQLTLVVRILS